MTGSVRCRVGSAAGAGAAGTDYRPARSTTSVQVSSNAAAASAVGASTHTRVIASAGSGRTSAHAVVLHHTHPVQRVHRELPCSFQHSSHHLPLVRPRSRDILPQDVRVRDAGVDPAQRELGPRHETEQPGERGERIDGRADLRHHEAAAAVPAQDQPGHARRAGQVVRRRRRPQHLDAVETAHLLGDPRGRHRQRHPPGLPLGGDQVEEDQQRPFVVDRASGVVDDG